MLFLLTCFVCNLSISDPIWMSQYCKVRLVFGSEPHDDERVRRLKWSVQSVGSWDWPVTEKNWENPSSESMKSFFSSSCNLVESTSTSKEMSIYRIISLFPSARQSNPNYPALYEIDRDVSKCAYNFCAYWLIATVNFTRLSRIKEQLAPNTPTMVLKWLQNYWRPVGKRIIALEKFPQLQ